MPHATRARHVAFGVAHTARLASVDPGHLGILRQAFERRHDMVSDTVSLNADVLSPLVGAGGRQWARPGHRTRVGRGSRAAPRHGSGSAPTVGAQRHSRRRAGRNFRAAHPELQVTRLAATVHAMSPPAVEEPSSAAGLVSSAYRKHQGNCQPLGLKSATVPDAGATTCLRGHSDVRDCLHSRGSRPSRSRSAASAIWSERDGRSSGGRFCVGCSISTAGSSRSVS